MHGTYDIFDLNEKSKYGILTSDEIEYIIAKIKNIRPFSYDSENLSLYIQSLALAGGLEHKNLVEHFLYYLFDEDAVAQAIYSVCSYWRLTREYIEEICYFIRGIDWGCGSYYQTICIEIAEDFLQEKFNKHLLEALIDTFETALEDFLSNPIIDDIPSIRSTDHKILCSTYTTILKSMRKPYSEIPSSKEVQSILENNQLHLLDMETINKAKNLVKEAPTEFYDTSTYEIPKKENIYRGDQIDLVFWSDLYGDDYFGQDQFNYLIERIKKNGSRSDDQDIPTFIKTLFKTNAEISLTLDNYRSVLEPYLYFPQDSYFSALALDTLCRWGFTEHYLKEIKEFLKGVSWDVQHHAHFVAIKKAFRYLKETFDMELVELLLRNYTSFGDFESPLNTVDDILERDRVINIRFKAYYALKESIGITQEEDDILCQYINNENPKIEGASPLMQALRKIQESTQGTSLKD